VSRQGSKQRQG
jgi:hypothetical protein